jgi:hypothetical protein
MSESLKKRLAAVEGQAELQDAIKQRQTPAGWEPGVVWDGTKGEITTNTIYDTVGDWDDLLAERGLDPELYEIAGDTIRWTSYDGWKRDAPGDEAYSTICYSYKAEIRLKTYLLDDQTIPEDVYQEVRKAKKSKKKAPKGDTHFVVALSDWQTGNRDGGGVEEQVEKIANLVEAIPDRIQNLRDAGHNIGHVVIAGLGDLVEGTCGHYAAQQFRIEVDRREQLKLVRRGIRDIIISTAPTVDKMTVLAVGGNHGENRGNGGGKAFTSTGDNDDVAVFEQVAEIFNSNKRSLRSRRIQTPNRSTVPKRRTRRSHSRIYPRAPKQIRSKRRASRLDMVVKTSHGASPQRCRRRRPTNNRPLPPSQRQRTRRQSSHNRPKPHSSRRILPRRSRSQNPARNPQLHS